LQPKPHEWNFTLLDKYVDLAERHHTEILLTLGYLPRWAASRPDEASSPGGLGAASNPADIEAWREYVRKVATRYRNRIHVYEIWNEANLPGYYSGTISQMMALAREAYSILKEVDGNNLVVSPSAMGGSSNLRWLDDFLAQGGGEYCDIIGYHFYVTPGPPEAMLNLIAQVKQILDRRHVYKRVWDTETGWASGKQFADDDERMGYLARSYILAWASGIDRLYWYAYDNYNWSTLPLTLPDGRTLNAAGTALENLQSWLVNVRLQSCSHNARGLWTCEIIEQNRMPGLILWSTSQETVPATLSLRFKNPHLHHLNGRTDSWNGHSDLNVGPSPILIDDNVGKVYIADETRKAGRDS